MFEVPILFIVFNRPSQTRRVFGEIRKLRPKFLYVAADGPRANKPSDLENSEAVRAICDGVDWDCQVKTLYRPVNLGCKAAVSSAIDWFFSNVEEGIILEDDILVDPSFFKFCSAMLKEHRTNEKVMHISGFNILGKWKDNRQSWHFSNFGNIWGWATWRRAWSNYDVNMSLWKDGNVKKTILEKYFPEYLRKSRTELYDKVTAGEIDTWDYQWAFCRLVNDGLSIVPSRNMVTNIGFDNDATHTLVSPGWVPAEVYSLQPPYKDPKEQIDREFDLKHLEITYFGGKKPGVARRIVSRVRRMF